MKKLIAAFLLVVGLSFSMAVSAQTTWDSPASLVAGENTIPFNQGDFRVTCWYAYTAVGTDKLLTLTVPSEEATILVNNEMVQNPYQSNVPVILSNDYDALETSATFAVHEGETVYLKLMFYLFSLPADATSAIVKVTEKDYVYQSGNDCSEPISVDNADNLFLPLTVQDEAPYMPRPVYLTYHAGKAGWLYLHFTPSVSGVATAPDCSGAFDWIKHDYIIDPSSNKAIGARAHIEVAEGETVLMAVIGFTPAMLTTELVEPVEGEMCDFPLDVDLGELTLPAAAGDYYYRFNLPTTEGYAEITSDVKLPGGGYVEITMDCLGTGQFIIYNDLTLRSWVFSRMDYIIHVHKALDTAAAEKFNLAVTPEQPFDLSNTGLDIVPGEEYSTPPFAGIYYYRITSPDVENDVLSLTTLATPANADTRVALCPVDLGVNLANGYDLTYNVAPATDYMLRWTVFDNNFAVPFKVDFKSTGGVSSAITDAAAISIEGRGGAIVVKTSGYEDVTVFDASGRCVAAFGVCGEKSVPLANGIYMVKVGNEVSKLSVK